MNHLHNNKSEQTTDSSFTLDIEQLLKQCPRDCRVKPDNDQKRKKHKARSHDMHTESIALQQRFLPQPVLRSSWLQLARFSKGSRRSR